MRKVRTLHVPSQDVQVAWNQVGLNTFNLVNMILEEEKKTIHTHRKECMFLVRLISITYHELFINNMYFLMNRDVCQNQKYYLFQELLPPSTLFLPGANPGHFRKVQKSFT